MLRCIWLALTPSPVLKNTLTAPEKPHRIPTISAARHLRAAATAWAAPPQPIFHPSAASLWRNCRHGFTTAHSLRPSQAGRCCPARSSQTQHGELTRRAPAPRVAGGWLEGRHVPALGAPLPFHLSQDRAS